MFFIFKLITKYSPICKATFLGLFLVYRVCWFQGKLYKESGARCMTQGCKNSKGDVFYTLNVKECVSALGWLGHTSIACKGRFNFQCNKAKCCETMKRMLCVQSHWQVWHHGSWRAEQGLLCSVAPFLPAVVVQPCPHIPSLCLAPQLQA